jgi:ribosomal protein S18 acetylase RimI-like enzyme
VVYERGIETALRCWEAFARATPGAGLVRSHGVAAAVFPDEPERQVYNNAVLTRDLDAAERADAIEAMESAYSEAGVKEFAAWAHESDRAMQRELARRGYVVAERTRAMAIELDDRLPDAPEVEQANLEWAEYVDRFGLPPGLLADLDLSPFHLLVGRADEAAATTALAFDWEGDCGIYNVTTLAHARRRGLGSALTALQLRHARARGCATASLQATPMAEAMYAQIGFRDLGRIEEFRKR